MRVGSESRQLHGWAYSSAERSVAGFTRSVWPPTSRVKLFGLSATAAVGTAPRRDAALWMALCTELKPEAGDLGEAGACAGADGALVFQLSVSAFELAYGLGASGEPITGISGGTSTGDAVWAVSSPGCFLLYMQK